MSSHFEFTLNVSGTDDLMSPQEKPVVPINQGLYIKKAIVIPVDGVGSDHQGVSLSLDSPVVILQHPAGDLNMNADVQTAVSQVRAFEKETRRSIFVAISFSHVDNYVSECFSELCRMVFMMGIDGIILKNVSEPDVIKHVRSVSLGLRGRRVRILLDGVSKYTDVIDHADGVILASEVDPSSITEMLSGQKLILTRDPSLTDSLKVDILISPFEMSTPPTSVPSSPLSSSRPRSFNASKSFLYAELIKFMSPATKLIIAFSDDASTASELSCQSRIMAKSRFPPILGMSASESSVRFMGCLFGVVPLQTQSFISIDAVVLNALAFAKERGFVQVGDEVVVVTQPPPVTASTNQTCFEGTVSKRIVV
jgi:hypothetical protein